jgi:hypothetical protein
MKEKPLLLARTSREFAELEVLLYDITGNDFRYDDEFEKTIKSDE